MFIDASCESASPAAKGMYSTELDATRMNRSGTIMSRKVPTASENRNVEVSFPNARLDMPVKKKAERPKADNGIAVAVPRRSGQFWAAIP